MKKLWIGLAVLAVLTPLGLLASGDAWGEWGADAFKKMLGFIPKGLVRFSDIWKAPLADYSVPGTADFLGYIISAFAGILLVVLATWLIGKGLSRKDRGNTEG
ncbi:MAG: cobalamin biosynthesis protein [Deltaproteobacteria bacterium]|nr:cobalamin biosynthesis protein [Deltaproteobacteria bacterium]